MNETQLQIVISLINNAADQLTEVGDQLQGLGTQATEAASQISSSLTDAENAAADAAVATAAQWDEASDSITGAISGAATNAATGFSAISDAALAGANQASEGWQASMAGLQETMASADSDIVAAATTAGEEAGTAAGEGFGGYFKKMIIGYALEQIGSFLSGGIESAISAVSQSSDKIASLTAQIDQQKASISVNEAALQKWVGTTAEVNAAHQKAAANIDAERVKITELTQQLAPLEQAQGGLPGQIESIVDAILEWIGAHKQLESELQTFMTTLGPMLKFIGEALIVITLLQVALSVLDGPLLILLAIAVAIAALTAIWETFHTQITGFFDDLNAKTGIITEFKQAWEDISSQFLTQLLPALQQLWTALQPLLPYLGDLAKLGILVVVAGLVTLIEEVKFVVEAFTTFLTIAIQIETFLTNIFVGAINKVEQAISALTSSTGFKAVASLVSGASGIGSAIVNGLGAAIPGFASGGIVTSPTLAMVGEAGPEAIIPLSAFTGGSSLAGGGGYGGGGNIVVNINGGSYLNQGGAQQIAQALATMIGQQLKLKVR